MQCRYGLILCPGLTPLDSRRGPRCSTNPHTGVRNPQGQDGRFLEWSANTKTPGASGQSTTSCRPLFSPPSSPLCPGPLAGSAVSSMASRWMQPWGCVRPCRVCTSRRASSVWRISWRFGADLGIPSSRGSTPVPLRQPTIFLDKPTVVLTNCSQDRPAPMDQRMVRTPTVGVPPPILTWLVGLISSRGTHSRSGFLDSEG